MASTPPTLSFKPLTSLGPSTSTPEATTSNRNQFSNGTHSNLPQSFTPPPKRIIIIKPPGTSSSPSMMLATNGSSSGSSQSKAGETNDKKLQLFAVYQHPLNKDNTQNNASDTKIQDSNGNGREQHQQQQQTSNIINSNSMNPTVSSTTNNMTIQDSNKSNCSPTPTTTTTTTTTTTKPREPFAKNKFRPKRNPPPVVEQPETPKSTEKQKRHGLWQVGKFDTRGSPLVPLFEWDTYLKISPAKVAPKEAFRHHNVYPQNKFELGMKLEAKDPRNSNNWCLASVVGIEGLHIRLRFDGADKMNDLYELVDSENIRSVGSSPRDLLLPPTGFIHSLANYTKFVEKVLKSEDAIIASPDCFPKTPSEPKKNLFEVGMKLEAVDRKNRDLICPATIGEVSNDKRKVKIMFDGWRGSFDYYCDYNSRDLFPINWCRDVGRPIQPPNGWELLLTQGVNPTPSPSSSQSALKSTPTTLVKSESQTSFKNVSQNSNQSSTAKKRGRPKKDPSPPSKSTTPFRSSTPKKDKSRHHNNNIDNDKSDEAESEQPMDSPNEISSEHTFEIPSLQDQPEPKNKYQCQRTISYAEWQKTKLQSQMPQDTNDPINSTFNESASMVSTVSYQQDLPESELSSSNGMPAPKRLKPDTLPASRLSDVIRRKPKEMSSWTVEDVVELLHTEEDLVRFKDLFVEEEIDGKAFDLLTTDILQRMGIKMGPLMKIKDLLEKVRREMALINSN